VAEWVAPGPIGIRFLTIEIQLGYGHSVPPLLPGGLGLKYRTYVLINHPHLMPAALRASGSVRYREGIWETQSGEVPMVRWSRR
jgi:hypothetical protein